MRILGKISDQKAEIICIKVEKSGPNRGNFGRSTPTLGFTTYSPFQRYNFLLKTLFSVLRVYHKSPFDSFGCYKRISGFVGRAYMQEWSTCRNGPHVGMVYMQKCFTCRNYRARFLAVCWLKKSFLSKVKGMNDWGIMQTFSTYVLGFLKKCGNRLHV